MNSCTLLACFYFLTSHMLECQKEISIKLKSNIREYDEQSCSSSSGMIHGKDQLTLTVRATISGFHGEYQAIFGLSATENGTIPIGTTIVRPYCPRFNRKDLDTCNCLSLEYKDIHFICFLLATCKLEERLYVYMYHNNTYYNTESFPVQKVYARCEDPPGTFSVCSQRLPKRVVTYPYDPKHARHDCDDHQVVHSGVDVFKMMGRVALHDIPSTTRVFVNFGVLHRQDKNSSTFLGTTINFIDRDCPSVDHDLVDSCTCLGDENDEFRVVCTLMATMEHSEKMAFFFLHTDRQDFYGDYVKMPRVLLECYPSSETSVLSIFLYIFLVLVCVIVCILSYICYIKPYYNKVKSNRKKAETNVTGLELSADQRASEFIEGSQPNQQGVISTDDDSFTL